MFYNIGKSNSTAHNCSLFWTTAVLVYFLTCLVALVPLWQSPAVGQRSHVPQSLKHLLPGPSQEVCQLLIQTTKLIKAGLWLCSANIISLQLPRTWHNVHHKHVCGMHGWIDEGYMKNR